MAISRRRFVRKALLGGLTASAAASAAAFVRFLWPEQAEEPPTLRVPASDVPDAGDDPVALQAEGRKVYLVSIDGASAGDTNLRALDGRCPYNGCTLTWRHDVHGAVGDFTDVFHCPCCGSVFARDGSVRAGPATTDMVRLPLKRYGSGDVRIEFGSSSLVHR